MLLPLGILASAGGAASDYELIATSFGTGSSGTVTFGTIPAGYKHLQLRYSALVSSGNPYIGIRLNGDSGSNYSYHILYRSGSSAASGGAANQTSAITLGFVSGLSSSNVTSGVADIVDAFSTTNYKTVKTHNGNVSELVFASNSWRNASAVTSVTAFISAGNFTTTSRFSLYGLKG